MSVVDATLLHLENAHAEMKSAPASRAIAVAITDLEKIIAWLREYGD